MTKTCACCPGSKSSSESPSYFSHDFTCRFDLKRHLPSSPQQIRLVHKDKRNAGHRRAEAVLPVSDRQVLSGNTEVVKKGQQRIQIAAEFSWFSSAGEWFDVLLLYSNTNALYLHTYKGITALKTTHDNLSDCISRMLSSYYKCHDCYTFSDKTKNNLKKHLYFNVF